MTLARRSLPLLIARTAYSEPTILGERSIYSIQHKEEYFPKAYTFVPEHWIPGGLLTQEEIERAHEAMHPFFNWASRLYRPIHGYATNQARYHSDNVAL